MKDSKTISLFLNTATKALEIGVIKDSTAKTFTLGDPKKALERTHLGIELLEKEMNFKLADVTDFYCLLGPGSNTGIRLGLTIPRTIYAFNPKIRLHGIKTMDLFTLESNYAALSDRNGNLFFAKKENEKTTYERIDKENISSLKEDNIVVEECDEMAISSLGNKNLIKINVLSSMMKHADAFIDFSDREEEYLPEYILKI